MAVDAVPRQPVSPCNFGKCREILTKCREVAIGTQLKAARSQELGWDSPYSRSREAIIRQQGRSELGGLPIHQSKGDAGSFRGRSAKHTEPFGPSTFRSVDGRREHRDFGRRPYGAEASQASAHWRGCRSSRPISASMFLAQRAEKVVGQGARLTSMSGLVGRRRSTLVLEEARSHGAPSGLKMRCLNIHPVLHSPKNAWSCSGSPYPCAEWLSCPFPNSRNREAMISQQGGPRTTDRLSAPMSTSARGMNLDRKQNTGSATTCRRAPLRQKGGGLASRSHRGRTILLSDRQGTTTRCRPQRAAC